jgi:hypothetical protein
MPWRCVFYTLVIIGAVGYVNYLQTKKCEAAGGVYTPNICVNPSAIIEMD